MSSDLEEIRSLAQRSISTWNDFFGELQGAQVSVNEPITQVGRSLDDINNLLVPRLAFIAHLAPEEVSIEALIPPRLIPEVKSQIQVCISVLEELLRTVSQAKANSGVMQFSPSNGYLQSSNGSQSQIYPSLSRLSSALDNAIEGAVIMYAGINLRGIANLSESINTYRGKINEVESTLQTIKEAASNAQKDSSKVRNLVKNVEQQAEDVTVNSEKVAKLFELTASQANQTTNNAQTVEQILASAIQLAQQVQSYKSQFDTFDKQMTQRREAIEELERDLSAAAVANKGREDEIKRLIEQSDQLIKGASVAGLASSFHETYEDYRKRADTAGGVVYVALALLFISVGFLGLYVYPGNLGFLGFLQGKPVDLPGVIGRAILIIPALAFVSFAGRRYATLFAMQREYAHRATLAKAIEGFRRLAPRYEEELTGAVFIALNRNPFQSSTTAREVESKDTDNLLKSLVESVPDILRRLGK